MKKSRSLLRVLFTGTLGVILSYTAMAQDKKTPETGVKKKLQEVKKDPATKDRAAKADVYIIRKQSAILRIPGNVKRPD